MLIAPYVVATLPIVNVRLKEASDEFEECGHLLPTDAAFRRTSGTSYCLYIDGWSDGMSIPAHCRSARGTNRMDRPVPKKDHNAQSRTRTVWWTVCLAGTDSEMNCIPTWSDCCFHVART